MMFYQFQRNIVPGFLFIIDEHFSIRTSLTRELSLRSFKTAAAAAAADSPGYLWPVWA